MAVSSSQGAGVASGALTGAAAGTMILPGIGTVIGGVIGAAAGFFGAGKKPKIPQIKRIDPDLVQQQTTAGNLASLPALEKLGAEVNRFNAEQASAALEMRLPGQFGKAAGIVDDQLSGKLPGDVSSFVQRQATSQALGLGVGGSGIHANITTRDLGLTSLQMQQQGLQNFGALAGMTKTPQFDISSGFLTPAQRLGAEIGQVNPQFQRDLLDAQVKAAPSPGDAALAGSVQQFGNYWAGINAMKQASDIYSRPAPAAPSRPVTQWNNWGSSTPQFAG